MHHCSLYFSHSWLICGRARPVFLFSSPIPTPEMWNGCTHSVCLSVQARELCTVKSYRRLRALCICFGDVWKEEGPSDEATEVLPRGGEDSQSGHRTQRTALHWSLEASFSSARAETKLFLIGDFNASRTDSKFTRPCASFCPLGDAMSCCVQNAGPVDKNARVKIWKKGTMHLDS